METSLRGKVKDFGAVRRSYESISKHNRVRGPSWQGGNGPDPDTCMHTRAHACTRVHMPRAGMQLALGWSAAPILGCSTLK